MGGRNLVIPVPANEARYWKRELAWNFERFCADGSIDPDELWDDIENMRRQLWVVKGKAAVLTTVRPDKLKTCVVTHAAGRDMRGWVHLWEYLENWAREIGCERIEAVARPGWERVLKDMRKTHVILEKRL